MIIVLLLMFLCWYENCSKLGNQHLRICYSDLYLLFLSVHGHTWEGELTHVRSGWTDTREEVNGHTWAMGKRTYVIKGWTEMREEKVNGHTWGAGERTHVRSEWTDTREERVYGHTWEASERKTTVRLCYSYLKFRVCRYCLCLQRLARYCKSYNDIAIQLFTAKIVLETFDYGSVCISTVRVLL